MIPNRAQSALDAISGLMQLHGNNLTPVHTLRQELADRDRELAVLRAKHAVDTVQHAIRGPGEQVEHAIAKVATGGTIVCALCNASDETDTDHRPGCPVWDLRQAIRDSHDSHTETVLLTVAQEMFPGFDFSGCYDTDDLQRHMAGQAEALREQRELALDAMHATGNSRDDWRRWAEQQRDRADRLSELELALPRLQEAHRRCTELRVRIVNGEIADQDIGREYATATAPLAAALAGLPAGTLTAGDQGTPPDGTVAGNAPADGCAERQSTASPSPAASEPVCIEREGCQHDWHYWRCPEHPINKLSTETLVRVATAQPENGMCTPHMHYYEEGLAACRCGLLRKEHT